MQVKYIALCFMSLSLLYPVVLNGQDTGEDIDTTAANANTGTTDTTTSDVTPAADNSATAPVDQAVAPATDTGTVNTGDGADTTAANVASDQVAANVAAAPSTAPEKPTGPEEIEIVGIDTVDISEPKGNWLYKRIWWERAEGVLEKTLQLVRQISQAPGIFLARESELIQNIINPFYVTIGLNQGEIKQILDYYLKQVEKERTEHGLSAEDEKLWNSLMAEKKSLETLEKSMGTIGTIEKNIDASLHKLIEQVNLAHHYEQLSWESFKTINRELSDKKARELYYTIDSYWKNVNNINTYIAGQFTQYFDDLVKKIHQETENVKSLVSALKERGIDIKKHGQQFLQEGTIKAAAQLCEEKEKSDDQQHWLSICWSGFSQALKMPFLYIYDGFTSMINWVARLFGYENPTADDEEEMTAPAVTPTLVAKGYVAQNVLQQTNTPAPQTPLANTPAQPTLIPTPVTSTQPPTTNVQKVQATTTGAQGTVTSVPTPPTATSSGTVPQGQPADAGAKSASANPTMKQTTQAPAPSSR